ncbi:MAG: DtxR family transcriptional regulator [Anaerolineales bacterium]|nr:DtxR family transcriptional regulator [Anaerolineales bacterium]
MSTPLFSLLITLTSLVALAALFWPDTGLYARWQRARQLSTRVLIEDALKHLFSCELDNRRPTLQSLAGALSVNTNHAAEITGQLQNRELITLTNGEFHLTPTGREYALRIVRAHRLWERYLSERTGYAEVDWHTLAEQREHQLSPAQLDALAASLGNPTYDPHGDPIPTARGEFTPPAGQPLSSLDPHQTARIVHLEDEPATIYSQLVAEGLHTGMTIRILDRTAERIRFWANGDEHVLAPLLANNISVLPIQQETLVAAPGVPLTHLKLGETARVLALTPTIRGSERRRLMDLGLLPGTEITAELQSPSGDPTAYIVRGALIALREEQAQNIKIARQTN